MLNYGSGIVLGIIVFPPLGYFLDLLFCPFSLQFATFGSWKLPFQRYLQHFRVRTSHFPWYLQRFGAQTFHIGWYCATRVHLGYVKVCLSVYFGLV